MKKFLLLAMLAACTTAAVVQQPKPMVSVVVAASPTDIVVTYTVSSSGGPVDSLRVIVGSPGYAATDTVFVGSNASGTKVFPNARPGVSGTFSGAVIASAWRRGLQGPTTTHAWSYTEPDVPPDAPTITTFVAPGS
jgi:hypothetical protein